MRDSHSFALTLNSDRAMTTIKSSMSDAEVEVLRGNPTRVTNLMEELELGVITAIAASAGCNIGGFLFDDGIDVDLRHSLPGKEQVSLRLQLKAVTGGWNTSRTRISAKVALARFDLYRLPNVSVHTIVVIMDVPPNMDDWVDFSGENSEIRHKCYWVSLLGNDQFKGEGDKVTVSAESASLFDDQTLCEIVARIRAGRTP